MWVLLPFLLFGCIDADPVGNSTVEADSQFRATIDVLMYPSQRVADKEEDSTLV